MDEHAQSSAKEKDNGNEKAPKSKEFEFSVDGRSYETEHPRLTGLQIKALASIDATFGVFLEARGQESDRQIGDGDVVDLSAPGKEQFYTTPPATFGMPCALLAETVNGLASGRGR